MFNIPGTEDPHSAMQKADIEQCVQRAGSLHPALSEVQWAPMATKESGISRGADENEADTSPTKKFSANSFPLATPKTLDEEARIPFR